MPMATQGTHSSRDWCRAPAGAADGDGIRTGHGAARPERPDPGQRRPFQPLVRRLQEILVDAELRAAGPELLQGPATDRLGERAGPARRRDRLGIQHGARLRRHRVPRRLQLAADDVRHPDRGRARPAEHEAAQLHSMQSGHALRLSARQPRQEDPHIQPRHRRRESDEAARGAESQGRRVALRRCRPARAEGAGVCSARP